MLKFKKTAAIAAVLTAGMTSFVATPAFADGDAASQDSITINGREFGPEDGLVTTTESFEITPGTGDTVGSTYPTDRAPGVIQPLADWGSSYARSSEYVQYFYKGTAKAAANVFSGKRIVQVCIQYTRSGKGVADKRCSNAKSNGSSWSAGAEAVSYAADAAYVTGPRTVFNISTSRIDPGIR
ncbi:hypothetical protein [Curtobacterium herbarum]|uniref:hypothetical protein n=1 Tax=Curtobacterium herbarum TaxID=150122 RepID=UPI0019562D76|nr:hypothetical protein [Curtobacterium herbarum]MBM7473783.1 hypothetical protein [Curtobacterium herbarum]MCS6544886.1 hypothetical protein [Curtobacterium herbarum]